MEAAQKSHCENGRFDCEVDRYFLFAGIDVVISAFINELV